ncbi:MAG: class I SAM-dependent methyltransferase [Chlamydiales bacterium]|nr:class I SAM-dependent methyltransferase [Chlamydiia bacterium]MCP5506709.1 class I SAM-dependent methyltransferase [Chlamydiales bacterium]
MRSDFLLFQSHIDLAHTYWEKALCENDIAIDATCGNGYDTLFLAKLLKEGTLYGLDIQLTAIEATRSHLQEQLGSEVFHRVKLIHGCHSVFSKEIDNESVQLIVYNLGYLPGGDKSKTTKQDSTLISLNQAMTLLKPGGLISITCYPGHPEGKREEEGILNFASSLNPRCWSCCHHRWCNRKASPSLLLIQRSVNN